MLFVSLPCAGMAIVQPIAIVFQALPHTLQLGPEVWRVLAKCHDVRNSVEYGGINDLNERLLDDLIAATEKVLKALDGLPPLK